MRACVLVPSLPWYGGRYEVPTVLALPTLDMYLSLSKFETIHWVSNDATPQTSL